MSKKESSTSVAVGISPCFGFAGGGGAAPVAGNLFLFEDGVEFLFEDGAQYEFEN